MFSHSCPIFGKHTKDHVVSNPPPPKTKNFGVPSKQETFIEGIHCNPQPFGNQAFVKCC